MAWRGSQGRGRWPAVKALCWQTDTADLEASARCVPQGWVGCGCLAAFASPDEGSHRYSHGTPMTSQLPSVTVCIDEKFCRN